MIQTLKRRLWDAVDAGSDWQVDFYLGELAKQEIKNGN